MLGPADLATIDACGKRIDNAPNHLARTCSQTSSSFFRRNIATRRALGLPENLYKERQKPHPYIGIHTELNPGALDQGIQLLTER
jgi:hypothetical protein